MTEWRPLLCSPYHEISEFGDVRRKEKVRNQLAGAILKPDVNPRGYLRVTIMADGVKVRRPVHQLVCEAWHGPRPSSEHGVAHADGDRINNHFSNLRWATQAENEADKVRHGTYRPAAKLTLKSALDIRALRQSGSTNKALAAQYGVSTRSIYAVTAGRTWK